MSTLGGLLAEGVAALKAAGVAGPRAEARLLLEAASGLPRTTLLTEPARPADAAAAAGYRALLARRATREPMAYILGRAEFWSLPFAVVPGVLVPRADTETVIEAALAALPDRTRPLRLLDIGTGTGCLALTLLHLFPQARAVATDLSPTALACAAGNARTLGLADRLRLVETSFAEGIAGPFDLVVSNPPYIERAAIAGLMPEVARFEPRLALDGGPDGLDAYRAILAGLRGLLVEDGAALFEIGLGQERVLGPLAAEQGFAVAAHLDLAGIIRCRERRPAPAA